MEAADEGAGAGFGEVVGGLVGGGNVGKADGAVADHLLAQPMKLSINVMELLCWSGGGSVRHLDAGRIVFQQQEGRWELCQSWRSVDLWWSASRLAFQKVKG